MTSRLDQPWGSTEDSAARLQRRGEREYRVRAERRRAASIVIALACAGLLLLSVGGVAMAVRAGEAPARQTATAPVAPAPSLEPSQAPVAAAVPDDISSDAPENSQPIAAEPSDPPAAPDPRPVKPAVKPAKKKPSATQRLAIKIGGAGYEPAVVKASSASPITLTVGEGQGCAAGFIMPSLGISEDNSNGPVTISLGKLGAGTYKFSCAMEMVEGRLVVE